MIPRSPSISTVYMYIYIFKSVYTPLQTLSINKRPLPPSTPSSEMLSNTSKRDVIRATDFNMLMVLGKGSFGKVLLAEKKVRLGLVRGG